MPAGTALRVFDPKGVDRTEVFPTTGYSYGGYLGPGTAFPIGSNYLEWFNRYAQLVQALSRAQVQQIRAAGEISRIVSQTSREISDMMRESYEQRQASQDRINDRWSQYMRGVDKYYDPIAQRPVELPSGYTNAWVNGQGEYIVTESVNFNPNVEVGGNWQKLGRPDP
jgi:hypothetical protein